MGFRETGHMDWVKIIDHLDAAVFVEDFDGNILHVNTRASEMFGYPKEEFYARGIRSIVPDFETPRVNYLQNEVKRKSVVEFEAINISKNGEHIPVKIHAKYVKMKGKEIVVITLTDLRPHRKYEKLLGIMGEHINEAIIITDEKGRVLHWNSGAEQLFGYTRGEIKGKYFYKYIAPIPEKYAKMLSKLNKKTLSYSYVPHLSRAEFKRKDGTVFQGEVVHSIAKIDNDIYGIAIIKDITELVAKEEEQKNIIGRYETILDKMLGGVLILKDEKIIYANPGIIKLTGYTPEEVIGKSVLEFIKEDYRQIVSENYKKRMSENSGLAEYLIQIRKKDGDLLWLIVKPTRIQLGDAFADLVSMVDITQIKNTEDMLFHFSGVISKIAGIREPSKIYETIWNEIGKKMNFDAMAFFEECGGKKQVVRFGDDAVENLNIQCVLREIEKGSVEMEDGSNCGVSQMTLYMAPAEGLERCKGVLVAMRKNKEINTDEKKMLNILASYLFLSLKNLQAMKMVEKSRNLQELLVHLIAHDLKTHLAIIRGYTELLSEKPDPAYIADIKHAVMDAVNLIEKTNMFSKLDMGQLTLARERVRIFSLIYSAISLVKRNIPEANINIEGVNEWISCYSLLIQEALYNIINNAFVHGAKNVVVSVRNSGDRLIIKISDDGPGIPDEIRDKIFNPFFKYMSSGTGLGLAIVQRIIELHGGTVHVEDNDSHGSVFVIEIPKAQ